VGQVAPRGTGAIEIQDGVEDLAEVVGGRAAATPAEELN
jgi:hypothetical protein